MATAPLKTKRSPTVLITDSREPLPRSGKTPKSNRPPMLQRASTKLISVDNVLQYASEIPSGQRRGPQPQQARNHSRTPSGRHPLDPKLTGRLVQQQHMPSRSSKVSEKLVLLPETQDVADEEKAGFEDEDQDVAPPKDDIADKRKRTPTGLKEKSYAERLPKSSRTEKLSRVTAYCTAQAYKMRATADFVRQRHGAKTKLYDDCLYTVYHLPLVPGDEGFRIRSSPVLKSPGGKAVLDEEIERNERHEYREGFFGEEQYGVRGNEDGEERKRERQSGEGDLNAESPKQGEEEQNHGPRSDNEAEQSPHGNDSPTPQNQPSPQETIPPSNPPPQQYPNRSSSPPALASQLAANLSTFAEMFIFSYGIVVFWNFTERQEKDILADLTFASHPQHTILSAHAKAAQAYANMKHSSDLPTPIPVPETVQVPLAVRPQPESDFETEEFHFEYNPAIARPRLYNDMITLRSGDHMIKLAMSHAIAQSTKLSFFEERMADTMVEAQYVPRTLALHGELGMKREEVVRILGRLFVSRVDVNLSSNMLDVPNFFWDSEPTLHPLYDAVRQYLEIKPRIQVLNERCRVFLDLAEILSDSVADRKMSRLSWIVIILIVLSILVTTSEVFLRFGILSTSRGSLGVLWAAKARGGSGSESGSGEGGDGSCRCACGEVGPVAGVGGGVGGSAEQTPLLEGWDPGSRLFSPVPMPADGQ